MAPRRRYPGGLLPCRFVSLFLVLGLILPGRGALAETSGEAAVPAKPQRKTADGTRSGGASSLSGPQKAKPNTDTKTDPAPKTPGNAEGKAKSVETPARAAAEVAAVDPGIVRGRMGIGLNTPGFGLRYFLSDRWTVEARAQFAGGVIVPGVRACRYFGPFGGVFPYVGVEGAYAFYSGADATASGPGFEVLGGAERFLWQRRISVQFDFGPAYVFLGDRNYDISASGIEFVFNVGLNVYFNIRVF